MFRINRKHRVWILLLACWLCFEPCVIPILKAEEVAKPKPREPEKNFEDYKAKEPDKALEKILATQGVIKSDMTGNKVKGALEGKAYADFLSMVTSSYDLMDTGDTDAISIIGCLDKFQNTMDNVGYIEKVIPFAEKGAKKLFMFMEGVEKGVKSMGWKKKTVKAFIKASNRAQKILPVVGEFLSHMEPPDGIETTKKFFNFFKKGEEASGMSKAAAAGHVVGIGLQVLSIGLSTAKVLTSDDWKGEKKMSYENVKEYANIIVGLAALAAMAFAFPIGTIVAIVGICVMVLSFIGDKVGEYNRRWKNAYKRSFDYLRETDPEFRVFYDNRDRLVKERRSAAWIVADRDYGHLVQQTPSNEADQKRLERIKAVYDTLVKQGVLATYYNRAKFKIPKLDLNSLQDLWKKKADYMAWKPTEEEAAEKKSTLGKVLGAIAVWNWAPKMIMQGMANRAIKDEQEAYPPVYFNPDFILCRRYQKFLMLRKDRRGALYDVVGLRIEQAPFNYIWMVAHDSDSWDFDLMLKAFEGDVFFCGVKEMQYLSKVAEVTVDRLKEAINDNDKAIKNADKFFQNLAKQRTGLAKLIKAYNDDPNKNWDPKNKERPPEFEGIFEKYSGVLGWKYTDFNGSLGYASDEHKPDITPKNIIAKYQSDIEQRLAWLPTEISRKKVHMDEMAIMIKGINDRKALFEKLLKDREEAIQSFEADFPKAQYPALFNYLDSFTFLGVGGRMDRFNNWLSGISPARKDMSHYTALLRNSVQKYGALVEKQNSGERGWWVFASKLPNPDEIIKRINEEREPLKEVIKDFEEVSNDLNLNLTISSSDETHFKEATIGIPGYKEELNVDDPIDDVMNENIDLGYLAD